jgi:hypothetical protein
MNTRRTFTCIGVCFAALILLTAASSARGAFHLWNITEVYSNASGTLQFIELNDTSGFDNEFVNGLQINVSNTGNTQTNTYTMPGNAPGSSNGHHLLLGTSGIHAAGAPTPDFIIPNNFLFTAGGSISYFAQGSGPYTALPTDGTNSRTWIGGGNAVNTPQNFAGAVGQIVVPEPGAIALLSAGGMCVSAILTRRRRRRSRRQ